MKTTPFQDINPQITKGLSPRVQFRRNIIGAPAPHKGGNAQKRDNPRRAASGLALRGFFLTDVVNHIGQHGPDMLITHHVKNLPPAPIRLQQPRRTQ